jgi:hypothetical protein
LYLVHKAVSTGIDDAIHFIEDSAHRHSVYADSLAQSSGMDLYLAGLAGAFLDTYSAVPYFYAALGAVMVGMMDRARALMHNSYKVADAAQRADGRETIRREALRLNWSAEIVNTLLEALPGPDADEAGETA